ncbi:MAG TPA: sugar phosphate isomerase/epimerase family protein [Dissulfurispiraceae bacterium]
MDNVHVHIPYTSVGDYLPLLREKKLNLEIYFSAASLESLKTGDISRLSELLDYGPSISIHAPFMDLSPGAIDEEVRAITVRRFSQVLDIAEVLLPKAIVCHSGYEKWKYAHRIDLWLEASLRTWRPLRERAALLGTTLAIENIFEDEPSNLELLMQELHSESLGICFDTGHCNLFSKVPLAVWVDALGPYIHEFHVHDNDGTFDSHLPVGDGTFDFNSLFSKIQTRNYIFTVEAHTPERVKKSLERLPGYLASYRD